MKFVLALRPSMRGRRSGYMEVVEDTDAIIVAGGDGTLGEVRIVKLYDIVRIIAILALVCSKKKKKKKCSKQ